MRQGCSLSPYLFNSVMDEILECVETPLKQDSTKDKAMTHTRVMAFEDDVVLFGKSKWEMQTLLNTVHSEMTKRGLNIHPAKCSSIRIWPVRSRKCMRIATKSEFNIERKEIPCKQVDGYLKYLGLEIAPDGKTRT